MRIILFFLLFPLVHFAQHARVFPQPAVLQENGVVLQIGGEITVEETSETAKAVNALHEQFEALTEVHLNLGNIENAQLIVDNTYTDGPLGSYQLQVDKRFIRLEYNGYEGLINGFTTLMQWIENPDKINGVAIQDGPKFPYRGTHLDCARHFYTVPELEGFIDQLALLKINRFHWHLTDDQGWRLEIKAFPKLTTVGAWRDSTLIGHFSSSPQVYEKERYGGFYTQEDARHIVAYCAERGIEVIPEIEMPGHARAALAAYPELGCTGELMPVPGLWGVFDDVFCSKLETRVFLKTVLDEVLAIFPSKTIHIGGDEVPKTRWNVCPNCQLTMKQHGLMDVHSLQSYFIQDISAYLQEKGRTLMGWDEILEGGLADNAQVMSWRGMEGGIEAAKAKHQVVMTPTAFCYFDYYQSAQVGEPLAIGGYLPLEKVLSFDPYSGLELDYQKYVIGGQANLWSEYLPTIAAVQYNAFPRLLAMSEVLWTKQTSRVLYPAFVTAVLNYKFPQFDKAGINYSKAAFEPQVKFDKTQFGLKLTPYSPIEGISAELSLKNVDSNVNVGVVGNQFILFPSKVQHDLKVEVSSFSDSTLVKSSTFIVTSHLLLGRELQFSTPPSQKYNVHGDLGLTDGIRGARPWKGNQWLGFENDTVQFQVNLKKKLAFNHMELQTLNEPGSWIYSPKSYTIEVSRNGKKWKCLAKEDLTQSKITFDKRVKAKYIRMTLINDSVIPEGNPGAGFTPWTFIDEWIITNN